MMGRKGLSALILLALLGLSKLPEAQCWRNSKSVEGEGSKVAADDDDVNEDTDEIIQTNPDYTEKVEIDGSDDGDGDDNGDQEEEDDEEYGALRNDTSIKSVLAQALKTSRKRSRQTFRFAKKNRSRITLALGIFAFRREIFMLLQHLATQEVLNPVTGKKSLRLRKVNPTKVLKLLIFLEVMRRSQSRMAGGDPDEASSSPLPPSLLLLSQTPLFKLLLGSKYNPAYLPPIIQHFAFERMNERYVKDGMALHKAITTRHDDEGLKWPSSDSPIGLSASGCGGFLKASSATLATAAKASTSNETVIVMDLTRLDSSVSTMEVLREQVSFLLSQYRTMAMVAASKIVSNDDMSGNSTSNSSGFSTSAEVEEVAAPELEIVVLLESPGGSAADYGLAASQLMRLRNEPGIQLTICVDKVAASGGYMMACVASPGKLLAAPFSVVGSIGVIGQTVNIHKVLEGWGVMPLVFRGGKDKAPVGLIGEVTKDGTDKVQEMVDDTHRAFKRHVATARPVLAKSIEKVGNGNVWLGYDALDIGLVDAIATSDDYLGDKIKSGARVLKLVLHRRKGLLFGSGGQSPYLDSSAGVLSLLRMAQRVQSTLYQASVALGVNVDPKGDEYIDERVRVAASSSMVSIPKSMM